MSAVTQDMIQEYIRKKGGRVKNVDLVKHFRKYLLFDDKAKKEQARELFKETVNSVALIRQEEGEKFLYLKDESSEVNQTRHASPSPTPSRTPLQSVQQSPNRTQHQQQPPPQHPSPARTPHQLSSTNSFPNAQQRTSQSSNLGRPTDLSNGRPPSGVSQTSHSSSSRIPSTSGSIDLRSSVPYQNGTNELQRPEEKSLSPKRKSPIPPPKPTDRYSSRNVSPPTPVHQMDNYNSGLSSRPMDRVSPRSVSPPTTITTTTQIRNYDSGSANSPKVLSPPRSHNRTTPQSSPQHTSGQKGMPSFPYANDVRHHHRPVSNSSPMSHHSPSRQPLQASTLTSPSHQSSSSSHHVTSGGTTGRGGGGHNRKKIDISGPVNVTALSNGPMSISHGVPSSVPNSVDDKQLFDRYTSELENIGSLSILNSSHLLDLSSSVGSTGDFPRDLSSHQLHPSSESSSLSSTSAQSTSSPPPVDLTSVSNPQRIGHRISQAASGGVGVQKLIQQYTVPPGAVVPTSPSPSSTIDKAVPSPPRSAVVGRSASSVSGHGGNVVLRRELTPPDAKVQRSHSNAGNSVQIRRSRLLERNSTLDTLTRQSIKGTHKLSHRLSKNSDELITNSKEELLPAGEDHDRDSPINERYDDFSYEIEPLEKEWMLALASNDMNEIHRILMTDSSFINKKGFLHGWTALHWAVKEENEELIRSLVLSGAKVDIRSNGGLSPLHIAAESSNEKMIRLLVYECNASTNVRDHSGRRPIDMLHPFAPESMRTTLRNELKDIPAYRNASLAIAMGSSISSGMGPANSFHIPRTGTQSAATLRKNWNSTGHLMDAQTSDKSLVRRSQLSPRVARKGFSFRRKKYQVNARDKRDSTQSEYYHERKES